MIRAVVKARGAELAAGEVGTAGASLADCLIHESKIYYAGAYHGAPIYARGKLSEGVVIPGPCIVSEMDSTTVILPGYAATVDKVGNLLINPTK